MLGHGLDATGVTIIGRTNIKSSGISHTELINRALHAMKKFTPNCEGSALSWAQRWKKGEPQPNISQSCSEIPSDVYSF
jgi:hypothetical protein